MNAIAGERGLKAVARVREVRERDSRLGLLHALGIARERERRVFALEESLASAVRRTADTLDDFVMSRSMLAVLATSVREAEQELESARTVVEEAHRRWQGDKTKVRAIEHLLDERALRRAEEAQRAEQRETDDIVGALQRRRVEESSAS